MIKSIGGNYSIYGLIIVKTIKKNHLVVDYGFSNTTFEPPNHVFAQTHNCTHGFLFWIGLKCLWISSII